MATVKVSIINTVGPAKNTKTINNMAKAKFALLKDDHLYDG